MAGKKRKFDESYIKLGFTFIEKEGVQLPQCVVCSKVLSNDSMRPCRLERHLNQQHPSCAGKPKEFFTAKYDSLKRMRLDSAGAFRQSYSNIVEASYEIALLIAKQKKTHTIGENLVKPAILSAARIVLGEAAEQKLKQISLSNDTVRRRIEDISQDIKFQVISKVSSSPFFAISCDESTDVSSCAQLIVYVRYIHNENVEEELLYSEALAATTKSDDIFSSVSNFFEKNQLEWNKLVGVCTDGAPAMLGCRTGFITKIKEKNPAVIGTHSLVHRQALASKTLPQNLRDNLNIAIKIVNYVKNCALNSRLFTLLCEDLDSQHKVLLFHTDIRWLSKGNMLARLYELKEEVTLFLDHQNKKELLQMFIDEKFQLSLAYLADIFEFLNNLNLKLQGKNTTILANYDHVQGFVAKLQLWSSRVESGNMASFTCLDEGLKNATNNILKDDVLQHLRCLSEEFSRYYADIDPESPSWKLTRNPFTTHVLQLPTDIQEEFLDFKADSTVKDDFQLLTLEEFWLKRYKINSRVAEVPLKTLLQFSSTYLCEAGFSALVSIKTKQRNCLNIESDLRVALSSTQPRMDLIVRKKQSQISH